MLMMDPWFNEGCSNPIIYEYDEFVNVPNDELYCLYTHTKGCTMFNQH